MGADEYDYRRDDYIEELRAEFELDQLQSYYLDNRFDLLAPARGSFDRARALYPVDATASFVFSICATDLILRGILLRPLLSGIVHDRVAAAIADELMNQSGMLRHKSLLLTLLREFAKFDLLTHRRPGCPRSLLHEIEKLSSARNAVVHRGVTVTAPVAERAIEVADHLFGTVLPTVLEGINLRIDAEGHIGRMEFYPDGSIIDLDDHDEH
jgi:hypothetical protein